jgi:hypothetical protein
MTRIAIVCAALFAALVPLPPPFVEQYYSRGLYPSLQGIVTPLTNAIPFALLDVTAAVLIAAGITWMIRQARSGGARRAAGAALALLVTTCAVVYLAFLGMWGLNYRRMPLEDKLEFDSARVTRASLTKLVKDAIANINAFHAEAHAIEADDRRLTDALIATERELGAGRLRVAGVPKRSILEWYFRRAAIDGMTDPFFLEIILNADVLPFERPFVLAHEWAHLAGYADESEASFVAWLACMKGDSASKYSAWMALYNHASSALPREERSALEQSLESGPRKDLEALARRYAQSMPAVRRAAHDAYDVYLRANRVEEGIESYHTVVRLILGAASASGWTPRVRQP